MTMLIDGHNDLAWAMRQQYDADLDAVDLTSVVPDLHTDLTRLTAGGVAGQFWSVYVSPVLFVGPAAVTATLQQIDFVRRLVARYPDRLMMATTADEVEASGDRVASLLGMEGGHCIDGSLAGPAHDACVGGSLPDLDPQPERVLGRLGDGYPSAAWVVGVR